tara:strand:- start:148 stop:372 length:225 start_codon:yes stop_codon:yes gene_type:complete
MLISALMSKSDAWIILWREPTSFIGSLHQDHTEILLMTVARLVSYNDSDRYFIGHDVIGKTKIPNVETAVEIEV